jgi:phenylalanyl-tRNA synthetase alpha chain
MADECETSILAYLELSSETVIEDTFPWAESRQYDHLAVVGAVKSLAVDEYVTVHDLSTSFYALTDEGSQILSHGSQEMIVIKALIEAGQLTLSELEARVGKDIAKIGMANCMKNKWVRKSNVDLFPLKQLEEVQDETHTLLKLLAERNFQVDAIDDKV